MTTEHWKMDTGSDEDLISKLRLDPEQLEAAVKIPVTLQCRKPSKQEFIRVHPKWELNVGAIELKEESDGGLYVVVPMMMAALGEEVLPTTSSLFQTHLHGPLAQPRHCRRLATVTGERRAQIAAL